MGNVEPGQVERQLAEYVVGTTIDDLPLEVRKKACEQLVWTIGTAIAGTAAPGSDAIAAYVRRLGGNGRSTVWGFGDQVPAYLAGFANAGFAKALEMEDKVYVGGSSGFGTGLTVVPAALAVAEEVGKVDGATFVRAIAVAAELEELLGRAIEDGLKDAQCSFVKAPVLSVFAATAASAILMGLDAEQTHHALGTAYAQATGSHQPGLEGGMGVRMQAACGVRNGIMAAGLAEIGITGSQQFLTGKSGLYPLFFPGHNVDWDLLQAPGKEYYADHGYKAYPSCLLTHGGVTAMQELVGSFDPDEVAHVLVYGSGKTRKLAEPREIRTRPKDFVQAQFSLPWVIACTMADGNLSLDHFADNALSNATYQRLAELIEVDAEDGRGYSAVEIEMKNGQTLTSKKVIYPLGHPENPQSLDEIVARYLDCVAWGSGARPEQLPGLQEVPALVLRDDGLPDIVGVLERLRTA